ncbi:MAG: C10 family peptidase [Bacteroidaceae bacterium]|nr:C10 family peptidase [Bacteroidaceae bacterium]
MRKFTFFLALFLAGGIFAMAQGEQRPEKHDILPMIKTKWAQNDPYYFYSPTYFNGAPCVTGCVSTAAAQVMKYYEWPSRGTGSSSYNWSNGVENKILSANYDHEYNWDLMLNDIDTLSMSPAQREAAKVTMWNVDAIARLMSDLGISFEMQYRPLPSSAYLSKVPISMVEHFDYDRSTRFAYRDYYTDQQWEDLIYNELAEGRPVIYAGSSITGSHSFVIDGYASGKFHCNWGWGGYSDGFYSLNNLTPNYDTGGDDTPGIEGYNKNHFAVIGIRPNANGNWVYEMGITKDFSVCETDNEGHPVPVQEINRETIGKYWFLYGGSGTSTDVGFKNLSPVDMDLEFGAEFTNVEDGNKFIIKSPIGTQRLSANAGFPYVQFSYTDIMQTGTFQIRAMFRPAGAKEWIPVLQKPDAQEVFLTVKGNTPPLYLTEQLIIGRDNVCYENKIHIKAHIFAKDDIEDIWINPVLYEIINNQPTPLHETVNGQELLYGQTNTDFYKLVSLHKGNNEIELNLDFPIADPSKTYAVYVQYYKAATLQGIFEPQSNALVMFHVTSEADAIKSVTTDWNSVDLPAFKGVLDLSGRRVADKPVNLKPGMYIINGKKIAIPNR